MKSLLPYTKTVCLINSSQLKNKVAITQSHTLLINSNGSIARRISSDSKMYLSCAAIESVFMSSFANFSIQTKIKGMNNCICKKKYFNFGRKDKDKDL